MNSGVYSFINFVNSAMSFVELAAILVAFVVCFFWSNSFAKFLIIGFLTTQLIVGVWRTIQMIYFQFILPSSTEGYNEGIANLFTFGSLAMNMLSVAGFIMLPIGVGLLIKQLKTPAAYPAK